MSLEQGKRTLGKLPPDAFGCLDIPTLDKTVVAEYKALPDLTGMVSDAMDLLGVGGAISGSVLCPTLPNQRMVGPALTVKNHRRSDDVASAVATYDNRLADIEAHNLAAPGDVLVVQGADGVSSLGGISAAIAKRQQEAGIVVDGCVRDVESNRAADFPVWARGTSPATGKWRLATVGINVQVDICGIPVAPGDLVVADDTGVCFVPRRAIADVLAVAKIIASDEAVRIDAIDTGVPLKDLPSAQRIYPGHPHKSEVP